MVQFGLLGIILGGIFFFNVRDLSGRFVEILDPGSVQLKRV